MTTRWSASPSWIDGRVPRRRSSGQQSTGTAGVTGVGTLLIEHVLDALAGTGVILVEAKTLDCSAGYGPYESTRAFWERRGFVQIDRIDPMPGWQSGSPCALYVAALGPTR